MNMQKTKSISLYKQQLRTKILETAIVAFVKEGIKQVKMDDVSKDLSISKRTVYEIFGNKEQLLYECVEHYYTDRAARMQVKAEHCKNVMEILLSTYKLKVNEFKQTNPQFYSDLKKYPKIQEFLNEQHVLMRAKMQKFFERGVKEGFFRKDVNYELVHQMFDMIGEAVTKKGLYSKYPYEELLTNLLLVPFRGFCTTKGLKMLEASMKKNNLSFTL
jgi:AcrR family transcriptional regulator